MHVTESLKTLEFDFSLLTLVGSVHLLNCLFQIWVEVFTLSDVLMKTHLLMCINRIMAEQRKRRHGE